jgi:hypothetical protein
MFTSVSVFALKDFCTQDVAVYCDVPESVGITSANLSIDAYEFTSRIQKWATGVASVDNGRCVVEVFVLYADDVPK